MALVVGTRKVRVCRYAVKSMKLLQCRLRCRQRVSSCLHVELNGRIPMAIRRRCEELDE